MSIEQRHPRKSSVAVFALILFYEAMGLHVSPQVGSIRKCSIANLTFEGLLAGVRPVVALQQPRPRKRLAADLAFTRQRVRSYVHFQSTRRHIRFVTTFALE